MALLLPGSGSQAAGGDAPTLSVNDTTLSEGDNGTTSATFTVTLSAASTQTVSVSYATADGTATSDSDYTATSGTLSFPAGATTLTLTVLVVGDTAVEANETFLVNLSGATGAILSDGQGQGTILNDDVPVSGVRRVVTSLADNSVAGTLRAEIAQAAPGDTITFQSGLSGKITLNGSELLVQKSLTIQGPGADVITVSGDNASRVFHFQPPQSNATITNSLSGLTITGGKSSFGGGIANESGSTLIVSNCTVSRNTSINTVNTVTNGGNGGGINSQGTLTVNSSTVSDNTASDTVYGSSGGGIWSWGWLAVNSSTVSGNTVSGSNLNGGGGGICQNGLPDGGASISNSTISNNVVSNVYSSAWGGGIRLAGGTLGISNCTIFGNSVLKSVLGNSSSRGGGLYGTGATLSNSIVAGNSAPSEPDIHGTVASGDYNLVQNMEGASLSGTNNIMGVAANLSALANNGGPTQTMAPQAGSLAVDAGDSALNTTNTSYDQRGAGFPRVLNSRIDIGAFESTPPAPSVSIDDVSVNEGNSGTTNATFTITLSASSSQTVTVNYATANGVAMAGSDYTSASGTLAFTPGETSKSVSVSIIGDVAVEKDETFFLDLKLPFNASLVDAQGIAAITNDDLDPVQPIVSITTPVNRSFVTQLTSIAGKATKAQGGSGIVRVDLLFKRNFDGKYWNRSAWGTTTPVPLSTTLQGSVWTKTSDLPLTNTLDLTKKLLDGSYLLTATAYDQVGNQKSTSTFFTLDKINPAVTITTPINQTFVTALQTISGTATDNEGGSGIARLDVFLKRNSDGKYWTGSAWGTTTPVALPAGLNKATWGITSSNLPSITTPDLNRRLTEGTYLVTATAYDKSSNQKSIGSFFTVDRTNPAVTITNPLNRSIVPSLSSITGTATDNAEGSGIARLDVLLKRNADGKYWTGSAWINATGVTLAVGLNNGKWGLSSSGLPSTTATDPNKRLNPGDYTLYATAYDRAGNQKSTSNFFTVTAASSATVSSLLASASSGRASAPSVVLSTAWTTLGNATLAFSEALDVALATDGAR